MNTQANTQVNMNQKAEELAKELSKFKTVDAFKRWWNSKSPAQKGATIGIIMGCGVGGYAFFATYKSFGIGAAICNFIIYGGIVGSCTTAIAGAAYTDESYYRNAMSNAKTEL